jgi:hypothetical protein
MKKALEEKGLSFADTAAKGEDLHKLIKLLYKYRDLMADSLLYLHPEGLMFPPTRLTQVALCLRAKDHIN